MDTEHPLWPQYEARFNELAFLADNVTEISIPLNECEAYLCLYGENGLSPEEELALLDKMDGPAAARLKKRTIQTTYWEDTVLFLPARAAKTK
ncbi:MAG: hypothetical protein QE263_01375 [Vampirovibrionales bacterium]|nr:hypothetical protein [Vampirovibrionales bacterium]